MNFSCENEFSFYLLEHHFSNSAALCYWPLRFYCQKLFTFQDLNYMKSRSQKCIAFLSFQDFRVHWQAQNGFSGIVLFSKAVWEDWAVQKVRGKTMWMHAQISWIPTPVLKPHCVSGYVLVCQTWNLVTKLGIRLGDNYRFFSLPAKHQMSNLPGSDEHKLQFWVPLSSGVNI